jgi:hypothetical protein
MPGKILGQPLDNRPETRMDRQSMALDVQKDDNSETQKTPEKTRCLFGVLDRENA